MLYTSKAAFLKACPPPGVVVGIDYSANNVGLAVSDTRQTLCNPLTTLTNHGHQKLLQSMLKALQDYKPAGFVMGWPMHIDGNECDTCPSIKRFASIIIEKTHRPVLLMDERFTTKIAQALLAPGNKTLKAREKLVDKIAASLILEGALTPSWAGE